MVFGLFLNRVAALLRGEGKPAWELVVDGKPLPVGRCSKDPDARGGALGRGYKLHAVWGDDPLPEVWEATAMREYEGAVGDVPADAPEGLGVVVRWFQADEAQVARGTGFSPVDVVAAFPKGTTG